MSQLSKKVERWVAKAESATLNALSTVTSAIQEGTETLANSAKDLNKMTINLSKGSNIDLSKEAPSLKRIHVGLSWDENRFSGAQFDLDASVIMVGTSGKLEKDENFIYFRNLKSKCGSVVHTGDNLTGDAEGDDEVILVDLDKVPADVVKLVFAVNIYNAQDRGQNFGMVENAAIRLVNQDDEHEVARFDLTEDASANTAMVFGELYRHTDGWKFKAVGQGFSGPQTDLGGILSAYR